MEGLASVRALIHNSEYREQPVLNDNCLLYLFKFLSYLELRQASRVCRQWKRVSQDNQLEVFVPFRILVHRTPKKQKITMDSKFIYTLSRQFLLLGDKNGEIHIWDKKGVKRESQKKLHAERIEFLEHAPDRLLSATKNCVKIWQFNEDKGLLNETTSYQLPEGKIFSEIKFNGTFALASVRVKRCDPPAEILSWNVKTQGPSKEDLRLPILHQPLQMLFFENLGFLHLCSSICFLDLDRQKVEWQKNIFEFHSGPSSCIFHEGHFFLLDPPQNGKVRLSVYSRQCVSLNSQEFSVKAETNQCSLKTIGKYLQVTVGRENFFFSYCDQKLQIVTKIDYLSEIKGDFLFIQVDSDLFLIRSHKIDVVDSEDNRELRNLTELPEMTLVDGLAWQKLRQIDKEPVDFFSKIYEREIYTKFLISDGVLYSQEILMEKHNHTPFHLNILDYKQSKNPFKRESDPMIVDKDQTSLKKRELDPAKDQTSFKKKHR